MNPTDQIMVQKHLGTTLAKVAAIRQSLTGAKKLLEKQEQALYALTQQPAAAEMPVAPVALSSERKSASILDGEVDMSQINNAIQRLEKGCDCPNLPAKKEGN
jgi:hypothetical protein